MILLSLTAKLFLLSFYMGMPLYYFTFDSSAPDGLIKEGDSMKKSLFFGFLASLMLLIPLSEAWAARSEIEALFKQSLETPDLTSSKATLQRIIELAPESDYGHFSRGWLWAQEKNYTMAVAEYQSALRIRPQFGEARNNLANAYFHLGQWSESIREYKEVLRQHPQWSEAHLNLGSAYFMAKETALSIEEWEKALRIKSDLFMVHYYLGLVYDKMGHSSAARIHFLRFLSAEKGEEEFAEYTEHASERQAAIWVEEGRQRT